MLPASTVITVPVILAAMSLIRNVTALATSLVVGKRLRALRSDDLLALLIGQPVRHLGIDKTRSDRIDGDPE